MIPIIRITTKEIKKSWVSGEAHSAIFSKPSG